MKSRLLNTNYFIDNNYLEQYIDLITNKQATIGQLHHILPVAYFMQLNIKVDNSTANLVCLTYADHCKAHWLLYNCTTGFLKKANANAFTLLTKHLSKLQIDTELTETDYANLQSWWSSLKNNEMSIYYTDKDELFLIKNFNTLGAAECAKQLNRTRHQIINKATALGLRSRKILWWTEEQIAWLKANDDKLTVVEEALYLNKTVGSVMGQRRRLGLVRDLNTFKYTDEDLQFLKNNYAVLGRWECAKLLNRTERSVQSKASSLGLHENQIAIYCPELDRTWKAVKAAAKDLQIADNLIHRVLAGVQKQTHGLHFEYAGNRHSKCYSSIKKAKTERLEKLKVVLTPEQQEQKKQLQREKQREYRLTHKEEHNAANRAWKAAHKDRVREYNKKQYLKK